MSDPIQVITGILPQNPQKGRRWTRSCRVQCECVCVWVALAPNGSHSTYTSSSGLEGLSGQGIDKVDTRLGARTLVFGETMLSPLTVDDVLIKC